VSTDLGFSLLIGFGGFKLVQLYKEVLTRFGWRQLAWWKSLLTVFTCVALALAFVPHRSVGIRVVVGLAASGSAAIWHAIDTFLRSQRDKTVTDVMSRNRTRR
jgi:hypothetical protein